MRGIELRKERTRSRGEGLEDALGTLRSRFGRAIDEEQVLEEGESLLSGILVTKTTRVVVEDVLDAANGQANEKEDMTVDEFGVVGVVSRGKDKVFPTTPSRRLAFAPSPLESTTTKLDSAKLKNNDKLPKDDDTQNGPRAPSPDIPSILSRTPRPSLAKSLNGKPAPFNAASLSKSLNAKVSARSLGVRSSSASAPGSVSASNNVRRGIVRRRVSEGPIGTRTHSRTQSQQGGEKGGALEGVLDAVGSGDEHAGLGEGGDDDDSDSSLDLHTPLPCVLFFFLQNRV
jgi:hypothetical protein